MRRWFALSAIGKDRPGIVADLAETIYELGCNLEDSSMTVLGGEFAVLLLFTGRGDDLEARVSAAFKRLEWEKRLTVFVRPLEGEPRPYGFGERRTVWELRATGIDKAGIVARLCRILAERDITIREMRTQTRPSAETGTRLYTMRLDMAVPDGLDFQELRAALDRAAEELRIDVSLEPRTPADL
jgi:glycine cleavage system transcriptional repressor